MLLRIFKNESLCACYHGLYNKCKKLKSMGKLDVFFVLNGTTNVMILENSPVKPVTHAADFKKVLPDIGNDNL